jgi:hypothetical protein
MNQVLRSHSLGPWMFFLAWGLLAPGPGIGKEPGRPFAELEKEAGAKSPTTRRNAAHALIQYPKKALPVLIKLLQDKDAGVRRAALRTVKMILCESSPLTTYGPAEPGLVLVPHRDQRGAPGWSGRVILRP